MKEKFHLKKIFLNSVLFLFFITIYFTLMFNRQNLIKYYNNDFLTFVLGSLPNFLAGLSSLILSSIFNIKKYLSFIIICSWLTFEEFHPFLTATKVCDIYDIMMTWLGGILSLIISNYHDKNQSFKQD